MDLATWIMIGLALALVLLLLRSIPTFQVNASAGINVQSASRAPTGLPTISGPVNVSYSNLYKQGTGAGLANEAYVVFEQITNGSPVTLDLTALTDVVQQAVALTAVKAFEIWLLDATKTAPDGVTAGNACSSITIDITSANPWTNWPIAGTTPSYVVKGGGCWHHEDISAAGMVVDSTHKTIKITNNDAGNVAQVVLVFVGI